jgi:hypothetical protein
MVRGVATPLLGIIQYKPLSILPSFIKLFIKVGVSFSKETPFPSRAMVSLDSSTSRRGLSIP